MRCILCPFAIGVDQPAEAGALVLQAHVLMHIAEGLKGVEHKLGMVVDNLVAMNGRR